MLFDIRRRSEAEEKAVAQEQERRALGLDLRKTQDYLQWVDHQMAQGEKPLLAVLQAARFNPQAVAEVEERDIPWLAISPKNRVYQNLRGKRLKAKQLLKRRMNERVCLQLPDSGRHVWVEEGQMAGVGEVFFLITHDVARDERTLFVARRGAEGVEAALSLLETYLGWEQAEIETKLHRSVRHFAPDGPPADPSPDLWHPGRDRQPGPLPAPDQAQVVLRLLVHPERLDCWLPASGRARPC